MLPDEDQNDERADREQHRGRDGESEDETRRLLHAGRTRARALTDGGERTQGGSLAAFALAVPLTVPVPLIVLLAVALTLGAVLAVGIPVPVAVAIAVPIALALGAVLAVGVPVAVPVARAVGVICVWWDAGARICSFIRRLVV